MAVATGTGPLLKDDSKPAARNNDSEDAEGGRPVTRSQIRSSNDESRPQDRVDVDAKPQYREKKHTASVDVNMPQSRMKNPPTASVVSVDLAKPSSGKPPRRAEEKNHPAIRQVNKPRAAGAYPKAAVSVTKPRPTTVKECTTVFRGGNDGDKDSVVMEVPRPRCRVAAAAATYTNEDDDDDSMKEFPAARDDDDDNNSDSSDLLSMDGDDSDYVIENNEDDG